MRDFNFRWAEMIFRKFTMTDGGSNIVARHMGPPMHNTLILRNPCKYCNK